MIEPIEINLLPVEYRVHHKKLEIKREVAYPLIGAAIISVVISLLTIGMNNSVWAYKNEVKTIQKSIDQNKPIQNQIDQLRTDKTTIQEKIKALELINVNREKWVKLMEEFSGRLPDYTWLVSIKEEITASPIIHIEGRTYSFPEVANYMSNLKECSYILSVDLSQIEKIDEAATKQKLFRFAISCAINPDAYLTDNNQMVSFANMDNGPKQ
jgi:Tfp pilus assembly protein PilN